ncbi:DMT family transporter [Desulfogranum japonicum]|uniref:DMT family transporter n=1 Tax=Desulfogranum japonicum TaxID=231447 RepID=UPI0003FF541F|nr:DMT family transporter [Desulfogranum japonicum]
MKNVFFYLATVLIWGSTWIGIKMQLGSVAPLTSVIYRFGLASFLLFLWCSIARLNLRFSIRQHLFMATQGVLLFGVNYLLFYLAELHIASGLAAVIFSTILLMNVFNGAIFLSKQVDSRMIMAGTLGLLGIALVFRPEITHFSLENHGLLGVVLCLSATMLASLGNITSAYNQKALELPIVQTNAYGMAYGTAVLFCVALVTGTPFQFQWTVNYVGSLLYLAVFGSIIAFGCYLALLGRIGADRAAYATLLFPLVALVISTFWEGYQWTLSAGFGVFLILLGNSLMIYKPRGRIAIQTAPITTGVVEKV